MPTVVQDVSGDSALQTAIAALKAKIEAAEESEDISQQALNINENVNDLMSAITNTAEQILNQTVAPNLIWVNGQIDGTTGQDKSGSNNQRTSNYTELINGSSVSVSKNQNVSLTIYFYEYDSNKALLRYKTGNCTSSADCVYFRIATYSTSVPQADQHLYVDSIITTKESLKALVEKNDSTQEQVDEIEYNCFENHDAVYTGSIPLTAGTSVTSSTVVCQADIPLGQKYTLKINFTPGAVTSGVTVYELDSNGQATNVQSAENNTEYEKTATKNVKGFSCYISGTKVVSDGTLTVTATIVNRNNDSLESKVDSVKDGSVASAFLYHENEVRVANKTGRYSYLDIYRVDNLVEGDVYTLAADECIGATNTQPICIYLLDENNNEIRNIKTKLAGSIVITASDMVSGKAIDFVLYPEAGTEMSVEYATFKNVRVFKGTDMFNMGSTFKEYHDETRIRKSTTTNCIAHRGRWGAGVGAMCLGSAVIAAKKHGYYATENDVAVTSDGKMVMYHDPTLARIGDSNHGISDYTLAQLKTMDFGFPYGFPGEKILTFEEWILLCKKIGIDCYIDFKVTGDSFTTAMAQEMVATVKKYGMQNHVSYLANHDKILSYQSNARLVFLAIPNTTTIDQYSHLLGTNELVFNPDIHNITSELVQLAYDNGFGCECWYSCNGDNKSEIFGTVETAIECGVQAVSLDLYTVDDVFFEKYGIV